jgi:hypothetical protein
MTSQKAERTFALICLAGLLLLLAAGQFSFLAWSEIQLISIANILLYGLTLFLFRRTYKSFFDPNPQVSIRAIMSGFMIKFFLLAAVALLYIFYRRKEVSIPVLTGSALLYVLYTSAEISSLLRLLKKSDHA